MLSHSVLSDSLDPTDYGRSGSSVHGILQARILGWVAMPSSRGSSPPRDWTRSPALQVNSLPSELLGKPMNTGVGSLHLLQGIFLTQESNRGLLLCSCFTSWATREAHTLLFSFYLNKIMINKFALKLSIPPFLILQTWIFLCNMPLKVFVLFPCFWLHLVLESW